MVEHSEDLTVAERYDKRILTQRKMSDSSGAGLHVFCLAANSASTPDIRSATSSRLIQ
jgi:hypothetical protein